MLRINYDTVLAGWAAGWHSTVAYAGWVKRGHPTTHYIAARFFALYETLYLDPVEENAAEKAVANIARAA